MRISETNKKQNKPDYPQAVVGFLTGITNGLDIAGRYKTHAKAKTIGSSKLMSKLESLRREIKADIKMQHDLYVNTLVGNIKANPRDFYQYIYGQQKDTQGIPALKRRNGNVVAGSELEQADEFNGQFTDVFNKHEHSQVPLLS